jgi:hypothetical protein
MSKVFVPRLDTLPDAQQRLWPELAQTPENFTLYGGTAIALHLGHRQSFDFDFFALTSSFEPGSLLGKLPYLKSAIVRQSAADTLTVTVDRGGPVQLSFFRGLGLGQVAPAEQVEGPRFKVAALIDLAGMKAAVVTQRAELKDYLDIHVLMTKANISLAEMLAAGINIYGAQFNPLLSLKAIAYHDDPALAELSKKVRHDLIEAVKATDPQRLPVLSAVRKRAAEP